LTSIYNKDLKLDSVKMQIIQEYYGNNKSSYEISRELGIPARTIQNFLAKDTHKGWHLENEEIIDKYFNGLGGKTVGDMIQELRDDPLADIFKGTWLECKDDSITPADIKGSFEWPAPEHQIGIWPPYKSDEEDEKLVNKAKHLLNIEKAKKFYDVSRSAIVNGSKMIRIPSQYLEEDVSESDAEVLDAFLKCMENLEKCQENGILFIGMSQQEITNLIESIRSGVEVFTDKEGNTLCIDEVFEDRLTFKVDEDAKAFKDTQDLMKEVHAGKHSGFILPKGYGKKEVVDKPLKICIVADTQAKPNVSLDYMKWIGKYIFDKKPDIVVHIGDAYDFESLSSYDKGKKSFEGRRLKADIEAGNESMKLLLEEFQKDGYNPRLVFCSGNHENRFDRLADDMPELDGFVGTDTLPLAEMGWEVQPFLKPINIEGIFFVHYLANPMTGKPYGGTAMNQLKTVGNSFVVGHKQCLDVAIRPTLDGKHQIGIINGAAYDFEEHYKGYTGNNHFRGITMLHEVKDGFGLPMFISLDYLKNRYKE
jgi:hypothetical protein